MVHFVIDDFASKYFMDFQKKLKSKLKEYRELDEFKDVEERTEVLVQLRQIILRRLFPNR